MLYQSIFNFLKPIKGKNIDMSIEDEDLNLFINKINPSDNQKYRLIAKFNNNTFATIRFGE